MKVIAVIQARLGSTRLPGKVLMPLGGKPVIDWVVGRIKKCVDVDKVLLATTTAADDDALALWAEGNRVDCFRGDTDDVLSRYYRAGLYAGAGQDGPPSAIKAS